MGRLGVSHPLAAAQVLKTFQNPPSAFVWGHGSALEEKLKWRSSPGWESLSFYWSSPNISPNPPLKAQREGFKRPIKAKISAWLLFCSFCETQRTCHTHTQIKEFPMQKKYFLHHGSLPTASLIHRKPGCGLTKGASSQLVVDKPRASRSLLLS